MPEPLLKIDNLTVEFDTKNGSLPVLDGLSFCLDKGESMSLVGESGCGKSMTALALMGLLPDIGSITKGSILYKGEDLVRVDKKKLQQIRGKEISMIFQEPMTSLNPVFTIGEQIAEVLRRHLAMSRTKAQQRAIELLEAVKIPNAESRAKDYPHQLSGGQRQRVMIAIALSCQPEIIIADEPTTALDVTVQAEIFELLKELGESTKTAIILITHDMGVVSQMAEKLLVMYAGRKIEEGKVDEVLHRPKHPYTKGLIACVPHIQSDMNLLKQRLAEIPGIVPPLDFFGQNACMFAPRCSMVQEKCWSQKPPEYPLDNEKSHISACWRAKEV